MADEQENLGSDTSSIEESTNTQDVSADNSQDDGNTELSLDEQIAQALDEPADTAEEEGEEAPPVQNQETVQDNTVKCPDKFKNKDGSVDIGKVLKSYTELESRNTTEKSNWEKERADLLKVKEQYNALQQAQEQNAKNAGFNSALDMQQTYELAALEANEYARYLNYTDNPEQVRQMLIQYANNPTKELMNDIELEFAPEINKRIAVTSDRKRMEFAQLSRKKADTLKLTKIENIISSSVDKNPELFNYEPFKKLFVNTLHRYGDNFTQEDADVLMSAFTDVKGLYQSEFEKQANTVKQNNAATDKLSSITGQNSAPASGQTPDLDKLSQSELEKYIAKYI